MRKSIICLFALLYANALLAGPKIVLSPEIDLGKGKGNQYQSDLRCNPRNADEMCVTSKLGHTESETILFHTSDNGKTWDTTTLPKSGDPDVVFDQDGIAHWSFIDKSKRKGIGYRRSQDGGKTWSKTVNPGVAIDHPHITCDRNPTSPFKGRLYIAGRAFSQGVFVLRSADHGKTWKSTSLPLKGYKVKIPKLETGLKLFRGAELAKGFVFGLNTTADGTLLIPIKTSNAFLSRGKQYAGTLVDIYCLRSTDGGVTFEKPIHLATMNSPEKSGPGGANLLSEIAVGRYKTGQRAYLVYPQERDGKPAQLMLVSSDDNGKTWSTPRAVIHNAPTGWGAGACSIMTNQAGVLGVQWYSMKDLNTFDIYFAFSTDGGESFSDPVRISTATSKVPSSRQPRTPGQDQVYGDTAADGSFRLIWTDARNGAKTYTNYTRTVRVLPKH